VKVAAVERGDLGQVKSFGDGDDRRVGGAERKVGVGLDQFSHAQIVGEFEVDDRDGLLCDRA
jgi:hypothetical protein